LTSRIDDIPTALVSELQSAVRGKRQVLHNRVVCAVVIKLNGDGDICGVVVADTDGIYLALS
jgi:hypothetical protein